MKSTLALCILFSAFAVSSVGCSSTSSTTPKTDLGVGTAGPYSAHVYIEGAAVVPGGKSRFVLVVTGGMPTAVSGWVGTDTAAGSVITPASFDAADGDYDIDLVSPSPIPAGSKFFFQTDTNGKKDLGSVAYAK